MLVFGLMSYLKAILSQEEWLHLSTALITVKNFCFQSGPNKAMRQILLRLKKIKRVRIRSLSSRTPLADNSVYKTNKVIYLSQLMLPRRLISSRMYQVELNTSPNFWARIIYIRLKFWALHLLCLVEQALSLMKVTIKAYASGAF